MVRIRWWNIPIAFLVLGCVAAFVLPFTMPHLKDGFAGNVISEIWGTALGALVAFIVANQFLTERVKFKKPLRFYESFALVNEIGETLVRAAVEGPTATKSALSEDVMRRLRLLGETAFRKAAIYSNIFQVEQLFELERCANAATELGSLSPSLPDGVYMTSALKALGELLASTPVPEAHYNPKQLEMLRAIYAAQAQWR